MTLREIKELGYLLIKTLLDILYIWYIVCIILHNIVVTIEEYYNYSENIMIMFESGRQNLLNTFNNVVKPSFYAVLLVVFIIRLIGYLKRHKIGIFSR